jgi:4-amino-4-deoxy-L-arabinose transferase-like glycosyltransferase
MQHKDALITDRSPQERSVNAAAEQAQPVTTTWHRIALGAILLTAAFLNFFRLDQQGYANTYYAAAVKSMLTSWHNFFFVSFDPGGFVTVDKPPLGLWIQTLSAKLFGFSGVSLLLPEALAALLSVALLYGLVRRIFGPSAGLLTALALALTPISVVTSRNNTVDSILVLTVLLAAWAVSRAAESGRLRWLLLCALLVGLGFNIKMLEAYLVVPALGLMYLLGAPLRWRVRVIHLSLAAVLLLAISLSWVLTVDLTPASQRPYVGSSGTNSELNLAFGYNGLERLTGLFRGSGRLPRSETSGDSDTTSRQPQSQIPTGFTASETGSPGPLRFFNEQLGGQISWLLPLALFGLLAASWQKRPRLPLKCKQQALVLWGTWLVTMLVFFSIAGFFHTYYLVMLAPAICALVGIGTLALWNDYCRPGWHGWLLPLALLVTAGVQALFLAPFPTWSARLTPLVGGFCLIAAIVLIFARLRLHLHIRFAFNSVAIVAMLALLVAPATWSAISILQGNNSTLPSAGPSRQGDVFARFNRENSGADTKLIDYLQAHQGNTRYLLATLNAPSAAPIILATGKPVMALGGFIGSDRIVTAQQLANLVANGTVRFFLLPSISLNNLPPQIRELLGSRGGFGGMLGQNTDLIQSVNTSCTIVPTYLWQSTSSTSHGFSPPTGDQPPFGRGGISEELYDCSIHS